MGASASSLSTSFTGATSSSTQTFLPWQQRGRNNRRNAHGSQTFNPSISNAVANAAPGAPNLAPSSSSSSAASGGGLSARPQNVVHLALMQQSSLNPNVGGANSQSLPSANPALHLREDINAPANVLDQFGNIINSNNGINPVSANQNAAAAAGAAGALPKRVASAQVLLSLRDELFDKNSAALANFIGLDPPPLPSTDAFLPLVSEPISAHLFRDDSQLPPNTSSSNNSEKEQAELIRHLIRSIHSSIQSAAPALATPPSTNKHTAASATYNSSLPFESQQLFVNGLTQSHASHAHDDSELAFRLSVMAQVHLSQLEKVERAKKDRAARRVASKNRLASNLISDSSSSAMTPRTKAVDTTLRSFVSMNLQLLSAVQQLGASQVISSVLSTGVDCFLAVQPLSLCSNERSEDKGLNMYQVFRPLFQFLTNVATGDNNSQVDATVAVSSLATTSLASTADSPRYSRADRSKALAILFGAALASGNLEELLHVVWLLYSSSRNADAATARADDPHLGVQLAQFLPTLIAFQTAQSNNSIGFNHSSIPIDEDSEEALATPLFTHAHSLKALSLVYTSSWVCDSHASQSRSGCKLTGEGFVFHCDHGEHTAESGNDEPEVPPTTCGYDVCTHCVRREKERQLKVKQIESQFPAMSPHAIINLLTNKKFSVKSPAVASDFHALPPAALAAIVLSQLDRLALPYQPESSPSLSFTSPQSYHVRPSTFSMLFDPISASVSQSYTDTAFNSNIVVKPELRKFREEVLPAAPVPALIAAAKRDEFATDEMMREGVKKAGAAVLQQPIKLHLSFRTLDLLLRILESASDSFSTHFHPSSSEAAASVWLSHGLIISSCFRILKAHLYQLHLSELPFNAILASTSEADGQQFLQRLRVQIDRFQSLPVPSAASRQMHTCIDSLARESTEAMLCGFRFFFPAASDQMNFAITIMQRQAGSSSGAKNQLHPESLSMLNNFLGLHFNHFNFGMDLVDQLLSSRTEVSSTPNATLVALKAFIAFLIMKVEIETKLAVDSLSLDAETATSIPKRDVVFQPELSNADRLEKERTHTGPSSPLPIVSSSTSPPAPVPATRRASLAPPSSAISVNTNSTAAAAAAPGLNRPYSVPRASSFTPSASPRAQSIGSGLAIGAAPSAPLPPLSKLLEGGATTASSVVPSPISNLLLNSSSMLILENIQQFLLSGVGKCLQDLLETDTKKPSVDINAAVPSDSAGLTRATSELKEQKEKEEKESEEPKEDPSNESLTMSSSDMATSTLISDELEEALFSYASQLMTASRRAYQLCMDFMIAQEAWMVKAQASGTLVAGPAVSGSRKLSGSTAVNGATPLQSPQIDTSIAAANKHDHLSSSLISPTGSVTTPRKGSVSRAQSHAGYLSTVPAGLTIAEQRWECWKGVGEKVVRCSFVTTLGRSFFTALHLLLVTPTTSTIGGPSVGALAKHVSVSSALSLHLLPSLSGFISFTNQFHMSLAAARNERESEIEVEERFLKSLRGNTTRQRSSIATIAANLAPPPILLTKVEDSNATAATNVAATSTTSAAAPPTSTGAASNATATSSGVDEKELLELYPQARMGMDIHSPAITLLTPHTLRRVGPLVGAQAACAMSALPLAPLPHRELSILYFEVTIDDMGEKGSIGVGFTPANYSLHRMPGWDGDGFGYHGDDGKRFHHAGHGAPYGPLLKKGDIVGCAMNLDRREVFWTLNGKHLGVAFTHVDTSLNYHANVGMITVGEQVSVNFGSKPFIYQYLPVIQTRPIEPIRDLHQTFLVSVIVSESTESRDRSHDTHALLRLPSPCRQMLIICDHTTSTNAVNEQLEIYSGIAKSGARVLRDNNRANWIDNQYPLRYIKSFATDRIYIYFSAQCGFRVTVMGTTFEPACGRWMRAMAHQLQALYAHSVTQLLTSPSIVWQTLLQPPSGAARSSNRLLNGLQMLLASPGVIRFDLRQQQLPSAWKHTIQAIHDASARKNNATGFETDSTSIDSIVEMGTHSNSSSASNNAPHRAFLQDIFLQTGVAVPLLKALQSTSTQKQRLMKSVEVYAEKVSRALFALMLHHVGEIETAMHTATLLQSAQTAGAASSSAPLLPPVLCHLFHQSQLIRQHFAFLKGSGGNSSIVIFTNTALRRIRFLLNLEEGVWRRAYEQADADAVKRASLDPLTPKTPSRSANHTFLPISALAAGREEEKEMKTKVSDDSIDDSKESGEVSASPLSPSSTPTLLRVPSGSSSHTLKQASRLKDLLFMRNQANSPRSPRKTLASSTAAASMVNNAWSAPVSAAVSNLLFDMMELIKSPPERFSVGDWNAFFQSQHSGVLQRILACKHLVDFLPALSSPSLALLFRWIGSCWSKDEKTSIIHRAGTHKNPTAAYFSSRVLAKHSTSHYSHGLVAIPARLSSFLTESYFNFLSNSLSHRQLDLSSQLYLMDLFNFDLQVRDIRQIQRMEFVQQWLGPHTNGLQGESKTSSSEISHGVGPSPPSLSATPPPFPSSASSSASPSPSPPPPSTPSVLSNRRKDHLLIRSVSWSLWRLIMYKTLQYSDEGGNLSSDNIHQQQEEDAANRATGISTVPVSASPSSSSSTKFGPQLLALVYSHLQDLLAIKSTQSEYEHSLALEVLEAKRRAYLGEKLKKDAVLEFEKEKERELKRHREAIDWRCPACPPAAQVSIALTNPTCPICHAPNPNLIGSSLGSDRANCVFDFTSGGMPADIEDIDFFPGRGGERKDATMVVLVKSVQEANLIGPSTSFRWKYEGDGTATATVPSNVGLNILINSAPPLPPSNAVTSAGASFLAQSPASSFINDYSVILDISLDHWPSAGSYLMLFSPNSAIDVMSDRAPARDGVWLDHNGRLGVCDRLSTASVPLRLKVWHRVCLIRNSVANTLTLLLNDRTIDTQEASAAPTLHLKQPIKLACLCFKRDPLQADGDTPFNPLLFNTRVRLLQLKRYAMSSQEIALLSSIRSASPSAPLPYADHGANSAVTTYFDFCLEDPTSQQKLPPGVSIHGKRKLQWQRDTFRSPPAADGTTAVMPALPSRYFHVSPGTYLVFSHTVDQHNTPPLVKLLTPPPIFPSGAPPATTSTHFVAPQTLPTYTLIVDLRVMSMSHHEPAAIFLMTRSPKKSSSSSSSAAAAAAAAGTTPAASASPANLTPSPAVATPAIATPAGTTPGSSAAADSKKLKSDPTQPLITASFSPPTTIVAPLPSAAPSILSIANDSNVQASDAPPTQNGRNSHSSSSATSIASSALQVSSSPPLEYEGRADDLNDITTVSPAPMPPGAAAAAAGGLTGVQVTSSPPPLAISPPTANATTPQTTAGPTPGSATSTASGGSSMSSGSSSSSSSSARDRLNHSLLINHNGHFCFPATVSSSLSVVGGKSATQLHQNQWHRVVIVVEQGADLQNSLPAAQTPERGTEGGLFIYVDGQLHAECRGLAFLKHPGLALHNPFLLGDPFAAHISQSLSNHKARPNWSFDLRNVQVKSYAMKPDEISALPFPSPPFLCKLPTPMHTMPALPAANSSALSLQAFQTPCSLFFRPQSRTHLILHGPDVLKTLSQPGHFSVAMWIKIFKVTEVEQVLVSKPASTSESAWRVSIVRRQGTDMIIFGGIGKGTTAAQQAAFPFISTPLPARNQWLHVAATYDGSVYRLFVNGLVRKTGHSRTSFDGVNGPLAFGVLCSDSTHFFSHGLIADIAVWKAPLTIHEMFQVRMGHTATTCRTSLLCHIEFKEALTSATPNVLLTNSVSHEWMHSHLKPFAVRGITYADIPNEVRKPIPITTLDSPKAPTPAPYASPSTASSASSSEPQDSTQLISVAGIAPTTAPSRASSNAVSIDTSSVAAATSTPMLRVRQFTYENDMDENGLMYYLGCKSDSSSIGGNASDTPTSNDDEEDDDVDETMSDENGEMIPLNKKDEEEYKNPCDRGHVTVTCSQYATGADVKPISAVVGRTAERVMSATTRLEGTSSYPWFCIDLHSREFCPTHYTLRHYASDDGGALRDWNLEGYDKSTQQWVVLREHVNDTSLQTKGQTCTWEIESRGPKRFFSKFRVIMTSTVHSADYLCLSGFELYGSLLLNNVTQRSTISTDATVDADRQKEYSDWDRFANHINLHECAMSWLVGVQQFGLAPETTVLSANAVANQAPIRYSVYLMKKRQHPACVAEIHTAFLPWLWMMLRSLKMNDRVSLMMATDGNGASGIDQVRLSDWISLLLQLAQPTSVSVLAAPSRSSKLDGSARLVRLLSLRILRMLLPLVSPDTQLVVNSNSWISTTSAIPSLLSTHLSNVLAPIFQLIGSFAAPKSILPLLKEYSALHASSHDLDLSASFGESDQSFDLANTAASIAAEEEDTKDISSSLLNQLIAEESERELVGSGASTSTSKSSASLSFATFCANRLSFLPHEEMWEWIELCLSLAARNGSHHLNVVDSPLNEWHQLLHSHLQGGLQDLSAIVEQRRSQLISEENVPLPTNSSFVPNAPPASIFSMHPAIDRSKFIHLLAALSVMGGALDVWREGGRVDIAGDSVDKGLNDQQLATLLSLVRVSSLPYVLRSIKDRNLPAEINQSIQEGLYPSGGLLSDAGDTLVVLPSQQPSVGSSVANSGIASSLTWSQLSSIRLHTSCQHIWNLSSLYDTLKPLLVAPRMEWNADFSDLLDQDFLITMLRRHAFRIFDRSCTELASTSSTASLASATVISLLSSLASWSTRSTNHFSDAVNSVENLENRIKQMAVFEREHEDDRLFKSRERKKKTESRITTAIDTITTASSTSTSGSIVVASSTSASTSSSSSSSSSSSTQPLVSFATSISVHSGTCSGVGSGLGLDRSSHLQLIQLPEHRKDKKKRENQRKEALKGSKDKDDSLDACGREDIIYVASLATHHCVLTVKGKVFHAVTTPTSTSANPDRFVRLAFADKTRIVQVAVGASHTLMLTAEGRVWIVSVDGSKEKPETKQPPEPQLLDEEIGGQRVLLVGCGHSHSFALTHRGLYGFGNNQEGQLGLGHSRSVKAPTLIRSDDMPIDSIVQLVGGATHSLALTSKGAVYAWGSMGVTEKGTAAHYATPTRFTLPTQGASDRVIQIVAAENHSLFLTDQGHVYAHACGATAPGVLGSDNPAEFQSPKRIKGALSTQVVTMISTSRTMSAALTLTGEVYIMGLEVYKGRPTSKDVVLTPTLLPQSNVIMPVVFVCCSQSLLLTLLSSKQQKRELSTSPLTVQSASNKVNTNFAPYPSLACIVGDDAKFIFATERNTTGKRKKQYKLLLQGEIEEETADGESLNGSDANVEPLVDMATAADGLIGRHQMFVEPAVSSLNNPPMSASALAAQELHAEGIRIFQDQTLTAQIALTASQVQVVAPNTTQLVATAYNAAGASPNMSSHASPSPPGVNLPPTLPVGFTMSLRLCNFDTAAEQKASSPPISSNVFPPHPMAGGSAALAPITTTGENNESASSANSAFPMTLLSVQLPVADGSSTSGAPSSRALELCCDVTLTRFSLTLLHAEKFHFVVNLDDNSSRGAHARRGSKAKGANDKDSSYVWHTVTVVCCNVDRRLMVKVFIDGFCYLKCTDPRPWAVRDTDLPLTPTFLPLKTNMPTHPCTLPITMLQGWNGRCSDASVWLHALTDVEVSHIHNSGLFYLMNDLLEYRIYEETQQMHQLYIKESSVNSNSTSVSPTTTSAVLPDSSPTTPTDPSTPAANSFGSSFMVLTPAEETLDATVRVMSYDDSNSDSQRTPVSLNLSHFAPSACKQLHVDPLPAQLLSRASSSALLSPMLTSPVTISRSLTAAHKVDQATNKSGELVFHLPSRSSILLQRRIVATEASIDSYTFVMDLMLLQRPIAPICLFQPSTDPESALVHLHPNLTLSLFRRVQSPHKWKLGVWHRIKLSVNGQASTALLVLDHFCVAGKKMDSVAEKKMIQLQKQMVLFPQEDPHAFARNSHTARSPSMHGLGGVEIRAIQLTRKASTLQQLLSFGTAYAPIPSLRNLSYATRSLENQGFPARWASKAFLACEGHRRLANKWLMLHSTQLTQADEESQLNASVSGLCDIGVSVSQCKAALLRSQATNEKGGHRVDYERAVSWLLYHDGDAEQHDNESFDMSMDGEPARSPISAMSAASSSASASRSLQSNDNWRWKLDRAQNDRPLPTVNPTYLLEEDPHEPNSQISANSNAQLRRDELLVTSVPTPKQHFLRLPALAESEKAPNGQSSPPLIIRIPIYKKWLKHRSAFLLQRLDAEENLVILYARRSLLQLLTQLPKDVAMKFLLHHSPQMSPPTPAGTAVITSPTSPSSPTRFFVSFLRLVHCSFFSNELLNSFGLRIAEWLEEESIAIEKRMEPLIRSTAPPSPAPTVNSHQPASVIAPLDFPSLLPIAPLTCALIEEVIFQFVILIQHAHDETRASGNETPSTTATGSGGASDDKSKGSSSTPAATATVPTPSNILSAEGEQPILIGVKSSTTLLIWLLNIFNYLRVRSLPPNGSSMSLQNSSKSRQLYLLSKHLFCPQVMNLLFESVVVCLGDSRLMLLTILSSVLDSQEEDTPVGKFITIASAVAPIPSFVSSHLPFALGSPAPSLSCPSFSFPFLPSKPWLLKQSMLRLYQTYESKNAVWSVTLQTIIELNIKLENAARLSKEAAARRNQTRWTEHGRLRRRSSRANASPLLQGMNHPATPTTHTTSLTSATQNHSSTFPQVPAGHSAFEDDEEDEDDFDADAALLRSLTLAGSDFVYKSDFDKNGIVYHLGCDVEGGVWTNPALLSPPTIKVTSSGRHTTYSEVLHLSRTPVVALTSASQGSWICFDFLDRAIIPTHYTLRHYTQASYALRNWVFEGSIDGEEWVVLRQHINDTSLAARDATRTWAIELDAQQQQQQQQAAASNEPFLVEPYRKFRIRMTGPNSSNSWHLVCSGFEIYGKLIDYGALNANGRSSAFAGSAGLTCPPNPMWFHKVILSQQYMLAFHAATSMSTTPHLPTFDMFRIPLEFAKSIWMDFQASTNELVERKGGNLAFARTARQSSTAILSPHLLTPARAAAVYSHTPYGFGSAQHAVDGYFQDSVFTQACTQVEESPWFEVDLGTLHLVGEVMVALKRKIEPPTLENQSSAEKDEIPDALPSLMPAMANVAARANLNVNASSSPESIASDDSLPPIGAPITSDNPMMSPRLMRQISLIKNPTPPVAAAPNYLVLLADTPFPVRQTGVAFVESLKSHALFVAPLAPISSPSHALESSALHVKIDHSSASSTSATPIPRARFVRILYTGKGDLRLNQVAVFPPVNQTAIKPTLATTTSTGAPNTASTGANTEPPAPNASPSNSASTAASSNVGLSLAQRIQQITASSSSTSSSTSTATTPASTGLSSSVTSSSSSADPAALVPFYISVSLFNNKVALELLTYLHRLCEKRGINIMELNILAEQSDKDNKDPAAHSGLQLPFTPTELLQYPELSRLGSDIYENVSVIKLYLLLIQHFNKIIMGLLPLIDFSVQKKNTKVVVNPVVPEFSSISPTTALHLADSIRNIRHFLLWSSKRNVWEQSLAATVQSLPKPNIDVDLFAASEVAWSKKTDHHARRTVFGQVFSQRAKLPSVHFRLIRSSRAFTVNYVGMRATDAGGPYRDAFERMGNELQSQLLPLFIKVPNSVYEGSAANGGVDLWVPRPSSTSSQQLLMYEFVGKLVGLAIRTKNLWNLSWPSLVWKFLVQEEIHDNDIRMVDALAASQMERMHVILQAMTSVAPPTPTSSGSSSTAIDPAVLNNVLSSSNASSPCVKFTLLDSENRVQALIPNGHNINVTHSNFVDYVRATREYRVHEFDVQLKAIKRGLSSVIPPSVLSLLTWRELENQVCGRGLGVDSVELLEKMTKYSACARSDRHIDLFWRMLRERFTDEQRAQFLIFTYGRSRLPASSADVDTSFTIMRAAARPINPANPPLTIAQLQAQLDRQLPTSHTCGFALELPAFSSLDVMTERMLYAIAHCSEVDADGGNARTGNYRIEEEEDEETDDDDNGYEE